MTTKVTLRQKPISKGRKSLYLDFYPPILNQAGQPTRREFLGIYVFEKPKNPTEKEHNKQSTLLGEQIRQKWENQLNKPEIYTDYEKEQLRRKERGEHDFVAYFKKLAGKRYGSNHDNWVSAYHHLIDFTKGALKFAELDQRLCNDFKEFLMTSKSHRSEKETISQNTALSYFNKFKAALKQAYKDGYLPDDLNAKVAPIKPLETHRNFLTLDELNLLAQTECRSPLMKKVALFSALTGLRFSDIKNLTWNRIEAVDGQGYFIQFTQQKTKGTERLPISDQAFGLMGERGAPDEKVFKGLNYSAYENGHLKDWILQAGITKEITFHCFRHTYATLQLSSGTDIYTVSKMLGHRELKTTQIYTKIIDQAKRDAAGKIKLTF